MVLVLRVKFAQRGGALCSDREWTCKNERERRSAKKKRAPRARPAAVVAKAPVKKSKAEVVQKILKRMEEKLSQDDMKATLGDYIRLVQLEKELEQDEPREIKVTWIEPAKTESEE